MKRKRVHLCTSGMLAFIALTAVHAQTSADAPVSDSTFFRSARLGIHEMIDFATHRADFTGLPGIPSCCPRYTSASGVGASFALLYERPVGGLWLIGGRLTFETVAGTFRSREATTFIVAGRATPGAFEHTLETSYGTLGIMPTIGYRLFDSILQRFDVTLYAGLGVGLPVYSQFDQHEQIVEPQGIGVYTETSSGTGNIDGGSIPHTAGVLVDARVGLSFDVPLNRARSVLLAPEVWYVHGLSDIVTGESWRVRQVGLGLAFKYLPGGN